MPLIAEVFLNLHRLFDTCLFTFKPSDTVKIIERTPVLAVAYIQLLSNAPATGDLPEGERYARESRNSKSVSVTRKFQFGDLS